MVDPSKLCAYVTFQRRSDAEKACKALHGNLTVKNTRLRVMWARRGKARATRDTPDAAAAGTGAAAAQMPPPPPYAQHGKAWPTRDSTNCSWLRRPSPTLPVGAAPLAPTPAGL